MKKKSYKNFETLAIRNQTERSQYREHSTPIYATSSFVFDDVKKNLKEKTKAQVGKYIWEINLNEILSSVEKDKRIQKMQIKRSFPNKIDIQLLPHEPIAIYIRKDQKIFPIARDGTLMPEIIGGENLDVPVFRGTTLYFENEIRRTAAEILVMLDEVGTVLNSKSISELSYDSKNGFGFVLHPEGEHLKLGFEDFKNRILMAEKVITYLNAQGLKSRVIDVRFSKKVVVSPRNAP